MPFGYTMRRKGSGLIHRKHHFFSFSSGSVDIGHHHLEEYISGQKVSVFFSFDSVYFEQLGFQLIIQLIGGRMWHVDHSIGCTIPWFSF
jgi:hypothetical protein